MAPGTKMEDAAAAGTAAETTPVATAGAPSEEEVAACNNVEQEEQAEEVVEKAASDNGEALGEPGKMFIGGLSWQTENESLSKYFGQFGELKECVVMKDPVTRKSRGFGFVTFEDPASVTKVLQAGPHQLDEKSIDPKVAVPRKQLVTKTKKIFVGGLSSTTSTEDLQKYFETFGKVTECIIMIDKANNRHRGFGFVTFDNEDIVDTICKDHYHEISGKMVEAKKAQPRDIMYPSRQGPRMRPYGGYANVYPTWMNVPIMPPMNAGRGGSRGRVPRPMMPMPAAFNYFAAAGMDPRMRPMYFAADPWAAMRQNVPGNQHQEQRSGGNFNPYRQQQQGYSGGNSTHFQTPLSPTGPGPQSSADSAATNSIPTPAVAPMNQHSANMHSFPGAYGGGSAPAPSQLANGMGQMNLNGPPSANNSYEHAAAPSYMAGFIPPSAGAHQAPANY